jgi:predicted dinucleotide-utilizing enzyme
MQAGAAMAMRSCHRERVQRLARHLQPRSCPSLAPAATAAESMGVAVMGYGAIGKPVAAALLQHTHGMNAGEVHLAAVLVSSERPRPPELPSSVVFTSDPEQFFAAEFALCAEAAGQPAVLAHAERCLRAGRDFLVTSIGALTDDAVAGARHSVASALCGSGAANGLRVV